LALLKITRSCTQALLEVVDSGGKNMEIAIIRRGAEMAIVEQDVLESIVAEVEAEIEAAKAAGRAATVDGAGEFKSA
jgi:hypothetical protein